MSSTMIVYKKDADMRGEREIAHFKLPVKWFFGRRFCDTDGSIGYNIDISDREMIGAIDQMRVDLADRLDRRDVKSLADIEDAALKGHHFRIAWVH